MTEKLTDVRDAGLGAVAGTTCDYCRRDVGDCRPTPVKNRSYVPKVCDRCYRKLDNAERFDWERDRELYFGDMVR